MEVNKLFVRLTWNHILNDKRFIGGQIEVQETEKTYRGLIKDITVCNGSMNFGLTWCAYCDNDSDTWYVVKRATSIVITMVPSIKIWMKDNTRHIILVGGHEMIVTNIFSVDGETLDPTEVCGLDLNNLSKSEVYQLH